jgi:polygalacturonase
VRIHTLISVLIALVILQLSQGLANAQPVNASLEFRVRAFGALGDGKTKDTAAFQNALDRCAANGGGIVVVEPGNYLIGSIQLHAGTNLLLEKSAIVRGSPSADDYPLIPVRYEGEMVQGHRALIYADRADNIAIVGPGSLVGDDKIGYLRNPRGPVMIELVNCSNVELNGFTDRYRRLWSIHLLFCKTVAVRNLTIRTTQANGERSDPQLLTGERICRPWNWIGDVEWNPQRPDRELRLSEGRQCHLH